MAAVDLTTVAAVKAYMGDNTNNATQDAVLQQLITAASQFAESYCSRVFHEATYTDQLSGTGTYRLLLPQVPVTAVAAVGVDGASWLSAATSRNPGFQFDNLGLYAVGGMYFCRGVRNVEVTYTAGYADDAIPADLSQAVIELVVLKFKRRTNIDVTARMIAQETISYNVQDMPKSTRSVLDLYRRAVSP